MPDDIKCPECVIGVLFEMKMKSDSYYFCDACGWSEWDEQDQPSNDYLSSRERDRFEFESDW